ncbi:hypothetical protein KYC_14732 [Achromobacter arsenitoxydans SY8]|uniref:Uncharacterized protein n=1 Tax=Achromobacter arsenitoxydans SY8 TaxID=477184 RepID=H0F848_9BURK|nr:hypothetical protein KYC_14732 [Achromobacter arsenitoxydans SY8]
MRSFDMSFAALQNIACMFDCFFQLQYDFVFAQIKGLIKHKLYFTAQRSNYVVVFAVNKGLKLPAGVA